ncbi:MAG: acyl-CoA thioesterase [Bacteroidota bacterium]
MAQEEFNNSAETRQCKMVFPGTLNANGTLFGGEMLKWMDEVAFITATRVTRQKMFTAKVNEIEFIEPVYENSIVEIVGNLKKIGPVKLEISVSLFAESLHESGQQKAAEAVFVMTALDENNRVRRLSYPALTESF